MEHDGKEHASVSGTGRGGSLKEGVPIGQSQDEKDTLLQAILPKIAELDESRLRALYAALIKAGFLEE